MKRVARTGFGLLVGMVALVAMAGPAAACAVHRRKGVVGLAGDSSFSSGTTSVLLAGLTLALVAGVALVRSRRPAPLA